MTFKEIVLPLTKTKVIEFTWSGKWYDS